MKALLPMCLLLVSAAVADEPSRVAPWQVVEQALAHSRKIQADRKGLEAARARYSQALAAGLPSLTADAQARFYDGLKDASLGQLYLPAIESRYGGGVQLSQPIFTFGRISGGREGARLLREAQEAGLEGTEADATLQALGAYWNWSKAHYSLDSLRAAAERMEAHARDMRNQQEAGLATESEALAADVLLERTRLRLEEARRRLELARARIAFMTGRELPPAAPEEPPVAAEAEPPQEQALLDAALQGRPELRALKQEWEAAQARVQVQRADYFPQLSLAARYEQLNPNTYNFPPKAEWQDDGFAGVVFTWNLFDSGLTRARVAEARALAEKAQLRLFAGEEEIVLEVREARIQLQDAWARVRVAERALKSAARSLEAATDLWKNGLARHAEVLDAHAGLTDAGYERVVALADTALARVALEHAAGRLEPPRPSSVKAEAAKEPSDDEGSLR